MTTSPSVNSVPDVDLTRPAILRDLIRMMLEHGISVDELTAVDPHWRIGVDDYTNDELAAIVHFWRCHLYDNAFEDSRTRMTVVDLFERAHQTWLIKLTGDRWAADLAEAKRLQF